MIGTLGGGAGLVVIGFVARDHGIPASWLLSAALFLATAPVFLLLGRFTPVTVEAVPLGAAIGPIEISRAPMPGA